MTVRYRAALHTEILYLIKLYDVSLSTYYLRCYRVGFTLSDADFSNWFQSTQVLSEVCLINCLVSGLNGEILQCSGALCPLKHSQRADGDLN